jgi:hypothetical protein
VRHMNAADLSRAFRLAVEGFRTEVQTADQELGKRLHEALASLIKELN